MTTFTSWDSELYHHGIKGQKWGLRRFQNEDGSLTEEGKARYGDYAKSTIKTLNTLDRSRARLSVKIRQTKNPGKALAYDERRKNIEQTSKRILSEAEKNGLKINSKSVKRHVLTGKDAVKGIIGISAGIALVNVAANLGTLGAISKYGYSTKIAPYAIGPSLGKAGVVAAGVAHRIRGESGTKYSLEKKKK